MAKRTGAVFAFLSVFWMSTAIAQQNKDTITTRDETASARPGVVSGRIFAISNSGDLKPARMATVYLLWKWQNEQESSEKSDITHTPADIKFEEEVFEEMKANLEQTKRDAAVGRVRSESESCKAELGAYLNAVIATMEWSRDQKKYDQVMTTDADEEGNFKFVGVRPGFYELLAQGQAGFNEAFWESDGGQNPLNLKVPPGTEVKVKLASPKVACSTVDTGN